MAEDTFHETQHDLARTLIRTFYEALSGQFDRKDHITKEELDRAFNLIEDSGQRPYPPSRPIAGSASTRSACGPTTPMHDARTS